MPAESLAYDDTLMAFGREVVRVREYRSVTAVDHEGYGRFGMRGDGIAARIAHGSARALLPLFYAKLVSSLPNRKESLALLLERTAKLARTGLLDILGIEIAPPVSHEELSAIWHAARPMLIAFEAKDGDSVSIARTLEDRIDIAWHDLPLWRSTVLDGQDPDSARGDLRRQFEVLGFIAGTDKPARYDLARRLASVLGDDLAYVLSGLVAAKAAKAAGIRKFILQAPLGTPMNGSGIRELARAKALLHSVRELEDGDFKVYLEAGARSGGIPPDPEEAKARLAAVAAMMDDIEPNDSSSPPLIDISACPEWFSPADPEAINESIRITRHALSEYRRLRASRGVEDMSSNPQVLAVTSALLRDAHSAAAAIESSIDLPYEPEGLYEIMASGFLDSADESGR